MESRSCGSQSLLFEVLVVSKAADDKGREVTGSQSLLFEVLVVSEDLLDNKLNRAEVAIPSI